MAPWREGGGGGACEGHGPHLVHLCVHNTKRPNSTHPITVTSHMQYILPVMNRCQDQSQVGMYSKRHGALPPPAHTHNHSLVCVLRTHNSGLTPYLLHFSPEMLLQSPIDLLEGILVLEY